MSKIKFQLDATVREDTGRGASRRLRQADKIPAIVYGAGEDAVALSLDHNKTMHALANEAFYSHILTLNIGKKGEKVILKAMQRHPAKPRITHIDFLRVRADQKLNMHVPLHFEGEDSAPGVKAGGVFSHQLNDVEISCLPADLPEFIQVDVSQMQLDDVFHLSQLVLPAGVELTAFAQGMEGRDEPVISLHIPRVVEEAPAEAAVSEGEAAEGAEGGETPAAEGENKE